MCGVFGIRAPERDVARLTYFGLHALQHRGQESAGIAVSENGPPDRAARARASSRRSSTSRSCSGLHGELAIGHTRYSTTGSIALGERAAARPARRARGRRARAQRQPRQRRRSCATSSRARASGSRSTSDTELIAALIANDPAPLEEAVAQRDGAARGRVLDHRARRRARCSRSATRTASGRSCSAGSATTGSSPPRRARSTCVGADFEREVGRGELVLVDEDGLRSIQARRSPRTAARSASSSSSTSPGPTRGSTASRCTARACAWASGWPPRRRSRPTSCCRSPTRARRPRSASRARPASRSARA